jgi:hypothetical protein
VPGLSGHLRRFRALKIGSSSMATPRSKHIASNVANRYVAWFKYADLLTLARAGGGSYGSIQR